MRRWMSAAPGPARAGCGGRVLRTMSGGSSDVGCRGMVRCRLREEMSLIQRLRDLLTRRAWDERGFTLVELLMVMVIIGILAGLGFTGYNALQARAAKAQADVYWRDLNTAVNMYRITGGDFGDVGADQTKLDALAEFLATDADPWANATEVTEVSDPSALAVGVAYAIDEDASTGRYRVCVWVNGYSSTLNNDCEPGPND